MTNPEQRPEQPDREQIHDDELDLTGVVDQPEMLAETIFRAIRITDPENEVPEWGARAMARYLANQLTGNTTSALHHFAATGHVDHERLSVELADLQYATQSRDTIGVIVWLASYLNAIAEQERLDREASYPKHLRDLIAEFGPAFAAFLRLPDAARQPDIRELFEVVYYGGFDSVDALVADVASSLEVDAKLREADLDQVASPDFQKLVQMAFTRWDIVRYGGRFYLFEK